MRRTKLFDLRDALAALFRETAPSVPVIDGPVPQSTMPELCILVGTDGGENGTGVGSFDGYTTEQAWASVTNDNRRQEQGSIVCSVWAWSGSTDLTQLRLDVQAVVDALGEAIHANRALASILGPSGWIELVGVSGRERQIKAGADCRTVLTVAYAARIT